MRKKPLIIGITGGSASGKTTICSKIAEELKHFKLKVVHMDNYFKKERPKMKSPENHKEYDDFNHPFSFHTDRLINDLNTLSESSEENLDIIIVEGLLVLYEEKIRSKLNLAIYVDVRADERVVRRLRRNMEHGLNFDDISDYYLNSTRYRHDEFVEPSKWQADIILNGSSHKVLGIEVILSWIKNNIAL